MIVTAADIALLELQVNAELVSEAQKTCRKYIGGRGLSEFQGLILCRRIFHNSASDPPVSTTACTRGIPEKAQKGQLHPHGSVNSFRNVLTFTVIQLQKCAPGFVAKVQQNYRSAVWFGPWTEDEVQSALEAKLAPVRTERCFLLASSDVMRARGVQVKAAPANPSPDEAADEQTYHIPLLHPENAAASVKAEAAVGRGGGDGATTQSNQSRKRKLSDCTVPSLRPVLQEDLQAADGPKPAPPGGPLATVAVLTGDEWRKWNRYHTMGVEIDDKGSTQAERLDALKLCVELTKRLKDLGVHLGEPLVLERSVVLALAERDMRPRDTNLPKEMLLAVLKLEELKRLRGMAFHGNELQLMSEEGMKAAIAEIQEAEAAEVAD